MLFYFQVDKIREGVSSGLPRDQAGRNPGPGRSQPLKGIAEGDPVGVP